MGYLNQTSDTIATTTTTITINAQETSHGETKNKRKKNKRGRDGEESYKTLPYRHEMVIALLNSQQLQLLEQD